MLLNGCYDDVSPFHASPFYWSPFVWSQGIIGPLYGESICNDWSPLYLMFFEGLIEHVTPVDDLMSPATPMPPTLPTDQPTPPTEQPVPPLDHPAPPTDKHAPPPCTPYQQRWLLCKKCLRRYHNWMNYHCWFCNTGS
jgi:hypothetical protein